MVAEKRKPNSGMKKPENMDKKMDKSLKEGGRRGMDFFERNSNKTTEKTLKQVYSFCFQATLKLSACILKSKVIQG